ncbi:hemolysin family protein [Actinomadura parmotrematis]|uniref:CNNM domain-containing protein n=1 Tax=Actinomadura parmotrematis TaxID=2864039 RepID=A0ABS7FNP4_9ACTN|nr:CNNM domain-containing protein [Actinomadura parmotrematis]MBW8481193.1 CNNM domain-containing protein [Actinomadura parmotrematis]
MDLSVGAPLTLLLLAGNGFFVAAEFALVAAKRPRLEKAAAEGSRAAAQAVAGIRELSLMLAGAQLGITMCSLGLGVVSEPVFAGTLAPLFHAAGVPEAAAHAVAFVLALALVTFLHMVVGEMAPKSWAIARPERSATVLAPPFRAFARIVRPVLAALNAVTNLLLRAVGVRPGDAGEVSRTPEQLLGLAVESRRLGLIEESDLNLLAAALEAPQAPLAGLVIRPADIVAVPAGASPQEVVDTAARTGRTRLMLDGDAGGPPLRPARMVHVRDAYLARGRGRATPAGELAHPVPELAVDCPVAEAVTTLRAAHSHLGLVIDAAGRTAGLISLDDLLATLVTPA